MDKDYKPSLGLDHSELLDVHRWSDHPEANKFINEIYSSYDFSTAGKEKIAKKHLKVVLLDLYVRWKKDPDLVTAYHRAESAYKAKSRYNAIHISKKIIPVVDILGEVGLLHQAKGFHNPEGEGRLSRIWPSYALREMFKASRIDPKTIGYHPDRETVILRDDQGKDIEYEDTPFTIDLRTFLTRYNELLQRKEITHPKHQCSSFTVSIFNDGSWEKGGRFYNDWMFKKSEDRMDLILDGEPTIEIDFSANHPYLIYAERRLMSPWSFPENAVEDPYDHEGFSRAQIKKMFQVMNNSSSEAQALRGYEDPETGKNNLRLEHTRPILEAVKEKHSEIVDYFFLEKGLELMRKEAEVARGIMERFLEVDKPILPIHDSFVVQASQAEFLKDAMYEALREVVGDDVIFGPTGLPPVKVKCSEKVAPYMPPGTRGPEGLIEWNTILKVVWPGET